MYTICRGRVLASLTEALTQLGKHTKTKFNVNEGGPKSSRSDGPINRPYTICDNADQQSPD